MTSLRLVSRPSTIASASPHGNGTPPFGAPDATHLAIPLSPASVALLADLGNIGSYNQGFAARLLADEVSETVSRGFADKPTSFERVTREGLLATTPQVNTIPASEERPYPGDLAMEGRIDRMLRWNAHMMVDNANERFSGVGGHMGTVASNARIRLVARLHFIRGKDHARGGDHDVGQGHDKPWDDVWRHLVGEMNDDHILRFRRQAGFIDPDTGKIAIDLGQGNGSGSYYHPISDGVYEFHSVSMGLAQQLLLHHARINRSLTLQGLKDLSDTRIWAIFGDGSMDEPEAQADLHIAAHEKLPLKYMVNCNLQRLDGPVRGNGNVMLELESRFRAAGWKVIKVITGGKWDQLLARDTDGLIAKRFEEMPDGMLQAFQIEDGRFFREHFFGKSGRPTLNDDMTLSWEGDNLELLKLVEGMTDEGLKELDWGGHDLVKIYNAMKMAEAHEGPTIILLRTVKGYEMAEEAQNGVHNIKHLSRTSRLMLRDRLGVPLTDKEVEEFKLWKPGPDSPEVRYVLAQRDKLEGMIPATAKFEIPAITPPASLFSQFNEGSGDREISTTSVWMGLWYALMADPAIGRFFSEIAPDEFRTFGGQSHMAKFGIHSPFAQSYLPVDHRTQMPYREGPKGRILEMGLSEAAAISAFTSMAASHRIHGFPMIAAYIFYSMFGFQRIGDQIWGAQDMRARGFLVGAIAGIDMPGEGGQHLDARSPLIAHNYPRVRVFDAATSFEMAVFVRHALFRMFGNGDRYNDMNYLLVYNDNQKMPRRPSHVTDAMILSGMYPYAPAQDDDLEKPLVDLLGSGMILYEALQAQKILAERGVRANVWSVPSYSELAREAERVEAENSLHPGRQRVIPQVAQLLDPDKRPVIAASSYVRSWPGLIGRWVPGMVVQGGDGFGPSDTRGVLRRAFRIDAGGYVCPAMTALARCGKISEEAAEKAIREFDDNPDRPHPFDLLAQASSQ